MCPIFLAETSNLCLRHLIYTPDITLDCIILEKIVIQTTLKIRIREQRNVKVEIKDIFYKKSQEVKSDNNMTY